MNHTIPITNLDALSSARRALPLMLMCALLVQPTLFAQDANDSAATPARTFTKIGVKECAACHSNPSPIHQQLGITSFIRMVEAKEWWTGDKHAMAYQIVKPQNNELTRRICEKLGWSPQGPEFTSQCLTCHAGVDSRLPRPSETMLQFGVQCESCHGAASHWARTENHQQVSWRAKTPTQKKLLGMNDLRSPDVCGEICFSCHVGDVDQNRFVTHAMYAAGHPPLPPVELQTFLDAMPAHWKTIAEKPVPIVDGQPRPRRFELQDQYFAANFGQQFADPKQQATINQSYARTRTSMIGSHVAQRVARELLRDAASRESLWGDYALYDCNACHHELFSPSSRVQMPERIPGRPFPMTWWFANVPAGNSEGLPPEATRDFIQAFNSKPFGDRQKVLAALNTIAVSEAAPHPPKLVMTEADVRRWIATILSVRDQQIHDYWTAKQTGWMLTIAFRELVTRDAIQPQSVEPLLQELAQQLELKISKPQRAYAAEALFRDLENNNRYHSARTRDIFVQLGNEAIER